MPRRIPVYDYYAQKERKVYYSFDELSAILNVNEIALVLDICTETVLRHCKKGKLPAFRAGNVWRMRKERLLEYIEQMERASKK